MPTAALIGGSLLGAGLSSRSTRKAAASQKAGQDAALQASIQAVEQARSDAIPLFQDAQQNQLAGFGGALDIFNQSIPQQQQVFQQGNVGAQQALLAGMPQFQNAILGNQVDFSAFQPQTLDLPQFQPAELPQFNSINNSLGIFPTAPQPAQQQTPFRGVPDNFSDPRTGLFGPRRAIP